jgi:hypothetical protein
VHVTKIDERLQLNHSIHFSSIHLHLTTELIFHGIPNVPIEASLVIKQLKKKMGLQSENT